MPNTHLLPSHHTQTLRSVSQRHYGPDEDDAKTLVREDGRVGTAAGLVLLRTCNPPPSHNNMYPPSSHNNMYPLLPYHNMYPLTPLCNERLLADLFVVYERRCCDRLHDMA